ncbi:hypothetical protein ACS0TY_000102 [Phlomoides rotata]
MRVRAGVHIQPMLHPCSVIMLHASRLQLKIEKFETTRIGLELPFTCPTPPDQPSIYSVVEKT